MKDYKIKIQKAEMFKSAAGNCCMQLYWEANIGFGVLSIIQENGKITADTEYLGKEFLKQALAALGEIIEVVG